MSQIEEAIASHYGSNRLTAKLLGALERLGRPTDRLTPDDLSLIDEFHIAGREATGLLAPQLALGSQHRLIDLGSGVGGPARFFAARYGCRASGVDLTPEFVESARELTRRCGLDDRVDFHVGSVTSLPFPDASFDAATLFHVGMNLPDKAAMAHEAARVLKPGGHFLVYDVMRLGAGTLTYPMPWAREAATSFVEAPTAYRQALQAAGFIIEHERSHAALAKDSFARMRARMAEPNPPPSNIPLLLGELGPPAIANLTAAIEAGQIAPVELLARKPARA
jgi:ubiquinone/menaquinone biosynthesis C-methylase UbiE